MARLNVFVSFQFEKDGQLKNTFLGQAKQHTGHRFENCSLNEAYKEECWRQEARQAIRECSVVIVLVGQDTHNAPGVLFETNTARKLGKPVFQIASERARRLGYKGVPHIEGPIPWHWKDINDRLERL